MSRYGRIPLSGRPVQSTNKFQCFRAMKVLKYCFVSSTTLLFNSVPSIMIAIILIITTTLITIQNILSQKPLVENMLM